MKEQFERLVEHLSTNGFFLEEAVELLEKTLIVRTLEATGGNRSAAAKQLGIHRNTLQRKMIDYQLGRPRRKPAGAEHNSSRKRSAAIS